MSWIILAAVMISFRWMMMSYLSKKQRQMVPVPLDGQVDQALHDSGHAQRVSIISTRIAQAMQLPEVSVLLIGASALLHDVGKVAVPAEILNKRGKLTVEERRIMQVHAIAGKAIIERLPEKVFRCVPPGYRTELRRVAGIVAQYHHERLDGSGYAGLSGPQIKLPERIVAVADVFDAMTTDRPYRPAMDARKVLRFLLTRGKEFDGNVLAALLRAAEHPLEAQVDRAPE